ncbi:MAG: hypothetical protein KC931_08275 [Candidatus Omnitrophica bacterium]|nr:hypothetical protein [Candidatus Omnitrophota bacterium]
MKFARTVFPYAIGLTVLLFFAAVILYQRSSAFLEKGMESERKGDMVEAIESYEWAIQNYTPAINRAGEAIARLEKIATDSEVKGATDTAIEAWQGIVSGLAVIRHLSQPYPEEKAKAEREMNRLRDRVIAKRNAPSS